MYRFIVCVYIYIYICISGILRSKAAGVAAMSCSKCAVLRRAVPCV